MPTRVLVSTSASAVTIANSRPSTSTTYRPGLRGCSVICVTIIVMIYLRRIRGRVNHTRRVSSGGPKKRAGGEPSERDGDPGTDSSKERPSGSNHRSEVLLRSVVYHDLRLDRHIVLHAEEPLHLLFHFGHEYRVVLEVHL